MGYIGESKGLGNVSSISIVLAVALVGSGGGCYELRDCRSRSCAVVDSAVEK